MPWRAIAAATASLLPTWPTAKIRPPPLGASRHSRLTSSASRSGTMAARSSGRARRQAHQLDEVAAVAVIGAQRHARGPAGGPAAGPGRARSCGSTSVAWSARRGRTAARPARSTSAAASGRQRCQEPGRQPDSRRRASRSTTRGLAARAPMRRLEAPVRPPAPVAPASGGRSPVRAGSRLVACGHDAAAVATLAGLPASLRSLRFSGFSVPTSVSLSSPRMNASTRL